MEGGENGSSSGGENKRWVRLYLCDLTCLKHYWCVNECFMTVTLLVHAETHVFIFSVSVHNCSCHFPKVIRNMSPVQLMSEAPFCACSVHFYGRQQNCDKDNLLHHLKHIIEYIF